MIVTKFYGVVKVDDFLEEFVVCEEIHSFEMDQNNLNFLVFSVKVTLDWQLVLICICLSFIHSAVLAAVLSVQK